MLRLIEGCVIITCSMVMMRREAFDRLPPFDEGLTVTSDWAMYWEMAAAGMKMAYVDEPLLDYRVHDTNLTSDELRIGNTGLAMMDRIFARPEQLPPAVRRRKPWAYARWHLNTAEWALRAGRRDLARRHILLAARSRPLSIRPGWVRMLGIGSPPRQDPPSPREAPG